MEFAHICVSTESETERNADEKHVSVSYTYFHVCNKRKAVYRKRNLGDPNLKVIKVYTTVFIISHDKLT